MRCLVTGATGHIGSHLVRCLLQHNAGVAVLVRSTSQLWRIEGVLDRLHVIRGDLLDLQQSAKAIREFAPEVVFHLGWHGVGRHDCNEASHLIQNLYGSMELLRLAHQSGCRRWIGLGSQAEYGPYDGILTEDLPTRPVTFYGTSKLCVCLLSQKLCEAWKIDFVWLRLLASYGPMDDVQHLIPMVTLKLLAREKPALTEGEQRWDYLYVTDVAEAIYRVATTPNAKGIFNLSSGQAHTVRSIAERIRDLVDPNLPLGFGKVSHNPDQSMHLQANIIRLSGCTGWSPSIPLEVGLAQTVDWYQENKERYAH